MILALALALGARGPVSHDAPAPPTLPGLELAAQGRFEEALPVLDEEIKARPQEEDLGAAKAMCLLQLGRWSEALAAARDLADRLPADEDARILLGDALLLNFRPREAAAVYGTVPPSSPQASAVLAKRVDALAASGDDRGALAVFTKARADGVPVSDRMLASAARLEDDPRSRLALLRELAARRPEDAALKGEVKVWEALAARSPAPTVTPAYPGASKLKEIGREPSVPVRLDGKKGHWLALDTGSDNVMVNEDTARKLHLPVLAKTQYLGWGYKGPQVTAVVLLDRLDVAGRTLVNVPAVVNQRDTEFWTNKAGYVGLSPFLDGAVEYDRRGGHFGLYPSGTAPEAILGRPCTVLPVLWFRGMPLIPVMLQGRGPFPFLLDTGAPWSLLAAQHVGSLGIRVNSGKYGNLKGWGLSGAFSAGVAEQVRIGVAGVQYDRPVAFVTEVPQSFPVPVYGILGRDILNDFAMVFDGPGGRVALARYP